MVSIIVLAHNQIYYTRQCLKSLFEFTSQIKTPYEVIVVDNASSDGTKEYLQGLEQAGQIKAVYNSENAGFPKGNNQGVAIAKGEYLCLLNNDTILTKGWLENLLRCIKSDNALAAVGPYCNASSGYQQVHPQPDYKGDTELHKYAEKFQGEEKYVNFLVFFCCLIKRTVWDELGGLWEGYGAGNFDDNEFCYRLIERGYKMKICGNAFIHHYGSRSFKKNPEAEKKYAKLLAHNQKLFLHRINQYKTIGLSMIVSDDEKPEILRRSLKSVSPVLDSINIVFNYKHYPKSWKLKKLLAVVNDFKNENFDNSIFLEGDNA